MAAAGLGQVLHVGAIYAGALAFGLVGDWINLPLPWLIGSLVFATTLRLMDLPVRVPQVTRPVGQVLIAASVGLAFTPEAVAALGDLLIPMVAVAVLTVAAGFATALVMMRLSGVGALQAVLASVPMGPVEAANLAQRYGVDRAPVIFGQTLRIVALVAIIPPLLVALDGSIRDPQLVLRTAPWSVTGAALMVLCALGGALLARRLRISNPFFVGALAGAAGAAALSLPVTALPFPLLVAAQTFLGVWLGAVFDRQLVRRSAGFIRAAFVCTGLMIVLCAALGFALVPFTGLSWEVMILATAPGSVTEMALTAKILQDGVAVVTAFHLVRIFLILPFAPLIARLAARMSHHETPR
ncbi:AbrB family transcriptional regulator [Rhodobaculum claviforme]|nr:AbrB family transcriptional regulator [Rhodobaculum claviforme]